jgi:hypothetical protein
MKKNSVLVVLKKARAFIRKGWCRKDQAKNRLGQPTGPRCDDAISWCAVGAVNAATSTLDDADAAIRAVKAYLGVWSIVEWNDAPGRRKSDVLVAFDRAIASYANPRAAKPSKKPKRKQ